MNNEIHIIEGKTYLNFDKSNPLLITIIGELAKADFRESPTAFEALWGMILERPVRIVRSDKRGTRVYINTPNKKRLAQAVFDEIRHYLGDQKNKPTNTADEALILEHCQSWVDGIPNADILNPQDYAAYVCGAVDDQLQKLNLDEEEHNAVVDAVLCWQEKQCQSPTAQPSEQATPPAARPDGDSVTTPQPPTEPSRIDKEKLKALFLPVFFADDYKQRETLNETKKMSRFDIFVERLESLLNDTHCTQKQIGNVAYMVHKSKFRKRNFRKFAPLCRLLFECCPIEAPKDQRPNKYSQPDNDTLVRFSDALGNP